MHLKLLWRNCTERYSAYSREYTTRGVAALNNATAPETPLALWATMKDRIPLDNTSEALMERIIKCTAGPLTPTLPKAQATFPGSRRRKKRPKASRFLNNVRAGATASSGLADISENK